MRSGKKDTTLARKVDFARLAREQWPYLCGILTLPVITLFIFAATLVSPGYSHVTDTISHLGGKGSPYPWIANAGIFLYGMLVLALAGGMVRHFAASAWGKALGSLLGINGASAIFAAVFETAWGEAPLEASVLGSSVHEVAARAGFVALAFAMVLFPAKVRKQPQWRGAERALQALAVCAVIFGLLFLFNAFPGYSGVVQRAFFAVCGVWLEVVALQMLRAREISVIGRVPHAG